MLVDSISDYYNADAVRYIYIHDKPILSVDKDDVYNPYKWFVEIAPSNFSYKPQLYTNIADPNPNGVRIMCEINTLYNNYGRSKSYFSEISTYYAYYTDEQWEYLKIANNYLMKHTLLYRWSESERKVDDYTSRPTKFLTYRGILDIIYELTSRSQLPGANILNHAKEFIENTSLYDRYMLALYVSICGAQLKISSEYKVNDDKHTSLDMLIQTTHDILFSKPYRKDWATCDIYEIYADLTYAHTLWSRLLKETQSALWFNDKFPGVTCQTNNSIRIHPLSCDYYYTNVMTDVMVAICLYQHHRDIKHLIASSSSASDGDSGSTIPQRRTKRFADIPVYKLFSMIDSVLPSEAISPLPSSAASIVLNRASSAVIPAFAAMDDVDMDILLVPTQKNVWNKMLYIYGMPIHDKNYPESSVVEILLTPNSVEFPLLFCERFNAVYGGLANLCDFMTGNKPDDIGNLDYEFHLFYLNKPDDIGNSDYEFRLFYPREREEEEE